MNAPKRKYRKYSTEEKNEMVRLYVGGMSAEAIGRQFNCFSSIIRKELIKKNIKIRSIAEALRNNKVNHDFFQNITTEKQAYWLGFLTADGCIYHNYAFGLALSIKDKDHIEKYRKDLEANYPIRIEDHPYSKLIPTANPTAKIVIYSKKIVNDLKSKGLTPRKSLMVQPYQEFAPNLRKHYWRGLIDGDGCLNFCKKWRISLHGTHAICAGFLKFINDNGILSQPKITKRGNVHSIMFSGSNQCKKIAILLYNDATIYLDRKMNLAIQAMTSKTRALEKIE